ncbi:MAG: hypothetical protein HZY79_15625 [Rhodoblastus sp.]|nr:MAG: hypothetical protein HZY79_15625 [Rhodoblastus sp.]
MGEVTWIDGFLAGVVAAVALALALGTIRRVSRMEHRFGCGCAPPRIASSSRRRATILRECPSSCMRWRFR